MIRPMMKSMTPPIIKNQLQFVPVFRLLMVPLALTVCTTPLLVTVVDGVMTNPTINKIIAMIMNNIPRPSNRVLAILVLFDSVQILKKLNNRNMRPFYIHVTTLRNFQRLNKLYEKAVM